MAYYNIIMVNLTKLSISQTPRSLWDILHRFHKPWSLVNKYLITPVIINQTTHKIRSMTNLEKSISYKDLATIELQLDNKTKIRGLHALPLEHESIPIKEQTCILYFQGNTQSVERSLADVRNLCTFSGSNVVMYDYQGSGISDGDCPTQKALVENGIYQVKKLQKKYKKVMVMGYSLGGSIAPQVASAFEDVPVVTINTFSSLGKVASASFKKASKQVSLEYRKHLDLTQEKHSSIALWHITLLHIPISIIDILFRITYLFCSIVYSTLTLDISTLEKSIFDLFITPLQNIAIFILSVIGTIFNTYITHICVKAIIWITNLTQEEYSTINLIGNSAFCQKFIPFLLKPTGWDLDGSIAWKNIKAPKLAFQAENDKVVVEEASLGSALKLADSNRKDTFTLCKDSTHFNYPWQGMSDASDKLKEFLKENLGSTPPTDSITKKGA